METLLFILFYLISAVISFVGIYYIIVNKIKYLFTQTIAIIITIVSLIPFLNLVGLGSLFIMYKGNKFIDKE